MERKGGEVELVKFKELEEKIGLVLQEYKLLKQKNMELEGRLKNTQKELEGATNRLRELDEERNGIHAKVDSLLTLLQDVEV